MDFGTSTDLARFQAISGDQKLAGERPARKIAAASSLEAGTRIFLTDLVIASKCHILERQRSPPLELRKR
jgi:hypothetical protein